MSGAGNPHYGPVTAGLAVPLASNPEVALTRPATGVLRVRYRGWTAELRGSAVVVTEQLCAKGSDLTDLIACIALAQSYVPRERETDGMGSKWATTPATAPSARQAAAAVLRHAAEIAASGWDRRYCDLYACLRRAWADHDYTVAYTALTAPLRHLVERGNLLDYNDTHTRADVVGLFSAAAELVERYGIRRPAARGAA